METKDNFSNVFVEKNEIFSLVEESEGLLIYH